MSTAPRLTTDQREQIRAAWAQGTKQRELAKQFGVTQATISKTVDGIPKVRASSLKPKRCCVGCGTPLRYKTRCEPCNQKWQAAYRQDYYLRIKRRALVGEAS